MPIINLSEEELKEDSEEIKIDPPTKVAIIAWGIAGIILCACPILWFLGYKDTSVIIFSVLLFWIGIAYQEIKAPEIGLLFQMGRYKGSLGPGWHLGIPFIWNIETRTTATQEIITTEEMYTSSKKTIQLRIAIYYKLSNPETSITLPEDEVESRIKNVALAKIKGLIGQKSFKNLLSEKGAIETALKENTQEELNKNGYQITDIEISDLVELIESEAEKIKEIGSAKAQVDKKRAEAIAEPLKSNYAAALVRAAETLGAALVNKTISKKGE